MPPSYQKYCAASQPPKHPEPPKDRLIATYIDENDAARELLDGDKADEFIAAWHEIYKNLLDLLAREDAAPYPTSLGLISEDGFRAMRRGDDEIGYFLIEKPSKFYPLNLSVDGGSDSNLKVANLPSKSNLSAINL